MWKALKNWHSSFLPMLIVIAGTCVRLVLCLTTITLIDFGVNCNFDETIGSEEDDLIRKHMAVMFEQFVLTYGSMSIGPDLLVSMIDRYAFLIYIRRRFFFGREAYQ